MALLTGKNSTSSTSGCWTRCSAMRVRPLAELGQIVGLKAPAVHDRVKRLESAATFRGYGAQLDGRLLGLELVAFIGCYTSPDCDYDAFSRTLTAMPEVCEVHSVAGEESFLSKMVTRSTQHLDELLARLKRRRAWPARGRRSFCPRRSSAAA